MYEDLQYCRSEEIHKLFLAGFQADKNHIFSFYEFNFKEILRK